MSSIQDAFKEAKEQRIIRLKREESARKAAKKERQIESCYRAYVPPQIKGFPELVEEGK